MEILWNRPVYAFWDICLQFSSYYLRTYGLQRLNNGRSTIIGHLKSLCDRRKALPNGHHDRHYLDIATSFINFNSFTNPSKTIFAII